MTATEQPIPEHPAQFSLSVLDAIRVVLNERIDTDEVVQVLDPFAGTGERLAALLYGMKGDVSALFKFTGVELQPAWADTHPEWCWQGDATALPADWTNRFDVLVTSPCYGNRMADHHNAQERCSACQGTGAVLTSYPAGSTDVDCAKCGGTGHRKYVRNTYAHKLRAAGHEPVGGPTDSSVMQWGPAYRTMHKSAWAEAARVVKPGGLVLVNISNHMRGETERAVSEWHLRALMIQGMYVWEVKRVQTRRNRFGANAHPDEDGNDPRVDGELLLVLHNGTPRR